MTIDLSDNKKDPVPGITIGPQNNRALPGAREVAAVTAANRGGPATKIKTPRFVPPPEVQADPALAAVLFGSKGETLVESLDSDKEFVNGVYKNGIWEKRTTDVGVFVTLKQELSSPWIHSSMSQSFELILPKIPYGMILGLIEFYREVMALHQNAEAMVQLWFNKAEEKYEFYVPAQAVTPVTVTFLHSEDLQNDENMLYVLDTHSHNTMANFFSGGDDRDERSSRLFAVFGKLNTDTPGISWRAGVNGSYIPLSLDELVEARVSDDVISVPEDSLSKIVKHIPVYPKGNPTYSPQGKKSTRGYHQANNHQNRFDYVGTYLDDTFDYPMYGQSSLEHSPLSMSDDILAAIDPKIDSADLDTFLDSLSDCFSDAFASGAMPFSNFLFMQAAEDFSSLCVAYGGISSYNEYVKSVVQDYLLSTDEDDFLRLIRGVLIGSNLTISCDSSKDGNVPPLSDFADPTSFDDGVIPPAKLKDLLNDHSPLRGTKDIILPSDKEIALKSLSSLVGIRDNSEATDSLLSQLVPEDKVIEDPIDTPEDELMSLTLSSEPDIETMDERVQREEAEAEAEIGLDVS